MAIDIVYILGDGAADNGDMPLRWSLRSLEKFGTGIDRIIVCGHIPNWLSDEVVKIPIDRNSEHGGKSWNILYAYRTAIERAGIFRPFLYSSDDHYLCRPSNMRRWPRYYNKGKWNGQLISYAEYIRQYNQLPIRYQVSLFKTYEILRENGLSCRRACVHLNTWADPEDIYSAIDLAEKYETRTIDGFEPTCLINAFYEKRMAEKGVVSTFRPYIHDDKVNTVEDCLEKIKLNVPGFSTSQKAETDPVVIEWMNGFYDRPSRWENKNGLDSNLGR